MGEYLAVLIVEDDADLREALCDTLELAGFHARGAQNGRQALAQIRSEEIGMVVTDVQMPEMDGQTLLRRIRQQYSDLPVVLMTAYGTIQKAVDAMRWGASDYLVKPFEASVLVEMTSRLLPEEVDESALIASDPRTLELLTLADRVAKTDATVMITGSSGSGKEVFARYIHRHSARMQMPFIAINCAAIPENMLEAILFGYEKGAFTGAYESRPGKFEQANKGTLLLDEISELDLGLQAKLLRVLQEREVERLGGRKPINLDVRVLATSNRNLRAEVAASRFREDLYYRLNVFPLHLPGLSERRGDILPLAYRFLARHTPVTMTLSPEVEQCLLAYDWPGNVRELDNVIQRALILCVGDEIQAPQVFFESPDGAFMTDSTVSSELSSTALAPALEEDLRHRETTLILETLRAAKGNRKRVAERLGISPRTLRYKLAKLREAGVTIPE